MESASVSLSAGSASPSYPLYRLYDRDIGRMFAEAAAGTLQIDIVQGGTPAPVDRLIIPALHNLQGMALDLAYSEDGSTWTTAASWTQPDGSLINTSFPSAKHARWRFIVNNPAIAPQFAELFLTSTYTWEKLPGRPGGPFDDMFNVKTDTTASGLDRFLTFGEPRRQRLYKVSNAGPAQRANILQLNSAWQGAKPFWLSDHEGNWIYGKLGKPLDLKETGAGKFEFDFNFMEVLG